MEQFTVFYAGDSSADNLADKLVAFKRTLVNVIGRAPSSNADETEHTFRVHTAPEIEHLKGVIAQTVPDAAFEPAPVPAAEPEPEPEHEPDPAA